MQFELKSEKQNPLFKRKEYIVEMNYEGPTPSKRTLQQMFAKEFKAEPNHVEISKIISFMGKDAGKIWIKIWEEKEIEMYTEKNAPKEEAPAETPAEVKEELKVETPVEKPKEETPVEEPKGEN